MLDITLLRLVKFRKDFMQVARRIPDGAINPQTKVIVEDFGKYFDKFPDHTRVDMEVFITLFRAWHNTLKKDDMAAYEAMLSKVNTNVPDDVREGVMRDILEMRLATELGNLALRFNEGEVRGLPSLVGKAVDAFKADLGVADVKYIDTDIDDILADTSDDHGVQWRLRCLNESMRPLQPGDLGIVAGRPDKGKTSFIASEATFWAPQLPAHKNVVWLNNEGPGKRIIPRVYQAALGITRTKLIQLSQQGVLKAVYRKVMGRVDRVRVVDVHGMDIFSVQQRIEANEAGVVIYDMLDNIGGFGDAARTDSRLEQMYQSAREFAVQHGHIAIATSQISADGDGIQYPTLGMLKDSKTGKQGACDFQLMIGSMNDPGYDTTRWLSLPKNKLRRDGGPGDPRATVLFSASISRYSDLDQIKGEDE